MLEKLFNLIKESASESVVNNPDIPNEKNDEVVAEATNTVAGGLQNILAGGGLKSLLGLFGGGGNNSQQKGGLLNNPIVSMMIGHFISKLTSKFNLSGNKAANVANGLIPNVLTSLINKTNDPNDSSFDMNSIIKSLSGGNQQNGNSSGFDFQNLLKSFTSGGMDTNQDGTTGLNEILSGVTGGAQEQVSSQNNNSSGGLMDVIKGFLK